MSLATDSDYRSLLAAADSPASSCNTLAAVTDGRHPRLWRCSVEKFHAMVRCGILGPEDRVELLEGVIVEKMTKHPLHRTVAYRLVKALESAVPQGFYVESQDPVSLAESEPVPDAAVIRGNSDDYSSRHPGSADVALVAEVADSSLEYDKIDKKRVYAKNGIAVYWIVNLVDGQIEVYSHPATTASGNHYSHCRVFAPADNVPLVIDGRTIAEISAKAIISGR